MSNYATKADLKNATALDTSKFAKKVNLASLKSNEDKLDIDKLVPLPVDFSKISDAVKNDVVKRAVYDKLVAKLNNIDTSGFALKKKYDINKSDLGKKISNADKKILDISRLVEKTNYNTKITEIENKIPSISLLATNSTLTAVENKIPDISSLVKKTDYDVKISEIEKKVTNHNHNKYITTPEFNKLTAEKARLAARLL